MDILLTLNYLGIERFAFAGVTLGGMTGSWLAANAPGRVTSLAVLCAVLTPVSDARAWHDRAALVRSQSMPPLTDMVVPRWFTPAFQTREPGQVAAVAAVLNGTDPEGTPGAARPSRPGPALAARKHSRHPPSCCPAPKTSPRPPRSARTRPGTSRARA